MDNNNVPLLQFGQHTVNSKFVVVFTKRTCDIIHEIVRRILFAWNRDVMVRAVKGGTHQVGHAGVQTGKLFVSVLDMQDAGHQITIRSGDISSAFREKFDRRQSVANNNLFIFFFDTPIHGG